MMPRAFNAPSFASTTYGEGGANTQTQGPGFLPPSSELLNFYKQLARRQLMMRPGAALRPKGPALGAQGVIRGPAQREADPGVQLSQEAPAMGSYKTIAGQTFLTPDPYGKYYMGAGKPPAPIPQNAAIVDAAPISTAAQDLRADMQQPQPEEDWRQAAMRAQFPTGAPRY
jgi:hypothetical protein